MVFLAAHGPASAATDFMFSSEASLDSTHASCDMPAVTPCISCNTACKACICLAAATSFLVASLAETSDPFWPANRKILVATGMNPTYSKDTSQCIHRLGSGGSVDASYRFINVANE